MLCLLTAAFPLKRQIMFVPFLFVSFYTEHLPAAAKMSRDKDRMLGFHLIRTTCSFAELMWSWYHGCTVHNVFIFSVSVEVCTSWRSCPSFFQDRSKQRNKCFVLTRTGFQKNLCSMCARGSILWLSVCAWTVGCFGILEQILIAYNHSLNKRGSAEHLFWWQSPFCWILSNITVFFFLFRRHLNTFSCSSFKCL